jgi:rhamnogalacturonyl hydrolase YesR
MNIDSYPLYDHLESLISNRPIEVNDRELSQNINSIKNLSVEDADNHYSQLNALIHYHEMKTSGSMSWKVPFNGKAMTHGKGITYTVSALPPRLQLILKEYCKMFQE